MSDHLAIGEQDPTGVDLYSQDKAITSAAAALRAQLPFECERIDYHGRYLVSGSTSIAAAYTSAGDRVKWKGMTPEITKAFEDLRKAMYRPGEGTWFSVKMTVWVDGRAQTEFNYDQEPVIGIVTPSGIEYLTDQHFFPIDEDRQPQWLKDRLAAGGQELHKYGKKSYPQWLVQMIADGNKPSWL